MTNRIISGAGGGKGGGGRTPREESDNLHSMSQARVIDLLSEGEIVGLVDGLSSIYLDDTPLHSNGIDNFQGVAVNWRNGTQSQEPIPGFPAVESGQHVGIELTSDFPFTRDITNLELSAIRVQLAVPQLFKVDTKNGDTNGHTVEYAIDLSTDGGPFHEMVLNKFEGKTTSKYQRSHEIVLPRATSRWTLRLRRLTPNANSSTTADTILVEALTEVIYGNFSYPNSALVGLEVSSEHFSAIPRRAYHIRGMIVRVPDNYDPDFRSYFGTWSGGFKRAWTNNPAWIFYDLITNPRYGLGDLIPQGWMDKASLYQIAQYCDQLVDDGYGGQEPRFTCNTYIQDRENAFDLIQKLASVFQGMAYYASGYVTPVADMPRDPSTIYSNSDVVDGLFTYSGSPKSTRYTVAHVGWNNPQDFFKLEIEAVEDREGMLRYGYQETQLTAFGCSSRGQAHRAGKWALLTSQIETQLCSFTVGLKGLKSRPGDIIQIADQDYVGEFKGGLISASTLTSITTDCDFTAKPGDTLRVAMPTGEVLERSIASISGRTISVSTGFTAAPQVQGTWNIEGEVRLQTYRVLSVIEKEGGHQYELKCVEYRHDKYDAIAHGTRLDPRPTTAIPPGVQAPPTNVRLTPVISTDQGLARTTVQIAWDAPEGAIAYEGSWRRNEGEWVPFARQGGTLVEIPNAYAGRYVAQVRAINARDIRSIAAFSVETLIEGKTTPPPVVTHLHTSPLLWGIEISWGFPTEGADDIQRTELWYSVTPNIEDAVKLDLAYPQTSFSLMGLQAGAEFYFWARLVDRSGNLGEFYPEGPGVYGVTSTEADEYLDAIRDEIVTTDLADQLINDKLDDAIVEAMEEAQLAIDNANEKADEALDTANEALDTAENMVDEAVAQVSQREAEAAELAQLMLNAERYIREDEDAQTHEKVEVLEYEVNENLSAAVTELSQIIHNVDSTLAESVITLEAKVDDNHAFAEERLTALATEDAALARSVTELRAEVGDDIAAKVTTLEQSIATTEQALSQVIVELDAKVSDDIQGSIVDLQQTMADEDGALAQQILTLDAKVNGNQATADERHTTLVNSDEALAQNIQSLSSTVGDNQALAEQRHTALTNEDTALAQSINSLTSTVDTHKATADTRHTTLVDADLTLASSINSLSATVNSHKATADTRHTALVSADTALSNTVTSLTTTVNNNKASADQTLRTLSDKDTALSTSINTLTSTVNSHKATADSRHTALTNANQSVASSVSSLSSTVNNHKATADSRHTTITNQTSALSNSISNLTSRVGTAESSINTTASTLATTNNKLSSLYTIKTQVTSNGRRYWAGIGLGVENNPNGPGFISQILLQADRVALLNTSNNGVTTPFAVQGGQVYINSALIQNASITNAKIASAGIDFAKIYNIAVTTGMIHDAAITNAKIANLSVTSGKIRDLAVDTLKVAGEAVSTTIVHSGTSTRYVYTPVPATLVLFYSHVITGPIHHALYFVMVNGVEAAHSVPTKVEAGSLLPGVVTSSAIPGMAAVHIPAGTSSIRLGYRRSNGIQPAGYDAGGVLAALLMKR